MISVKGEYSFKSLALFFSHPSSPIETRFTAGLNLIDGTSELNFLLSPRNNFFEDKAVNQAQFNAIDFDLIDRKLQKYGTYSIVEIDVRRYFIFYTGGENHPPKELENCALQTIYNFLDSEFGHGEYYFFLSPSLVFNDSMQLMDFVNDFISSNGKLKNVAMESARIYPIVDDAIPDEILTAGPSISPLEVSYVYDAAKSGWNSSNSFYLNKFEEDFASFVGSKFAMATSSCTGALHISLLALGIGPGDEVVVPDITWVATASAVKYVGATPVFVDVDPVTWTMDPIELIKVINAKTKAIIPVHLYGYGAPMSEIVRIAKERGISVVEDAAPAIGTKIGGNFAGSFGDFGCFSFQGAKLLVTGEGGMLVTNNAELFAKAKKIQDHGRRPGTFWIEELGYKYKMNNVTAALGLAQLQRAEMQIEKKREINSWYIDGLADLDNLHFQTEAHGTRSICWMTSFSLDEKSKVTRDELMKHLKLFGVDSRPVFPSISQYEIWGYSPKLPKFSKVIGDTGINLPSGVRMNRATVKKVIDTIRRVME